MKTCCGFPIKCINCSSVWSEELKTSCWSGHFIAHLILSYMNVIRSGRTVPTKRKGCRNTLRSIGVNNHYTQGLDNYNNNICRYHLLSQFLFWLSKFQFGHPKKIWTAKKFLMIQKHHFHMKKGWKKRFWTSNFFSEKSKIFWTAKIEIWTTKRIWESRWHRQLT